MLEYMPLINMVCGLLYMVDNFVVSLLMEGGRE